MSNDDQKPLSLGQFYSEVWRRAIKGKFEHARGWYALAAIIVGFLATVIAPRYPSMTTTITAIGWLPFAVFAGAFVWGFVRDAILAPHQIYVSETKKIAAANTEIGALKAATQPVLEIEDAGDMAIRDVPTMVPAQMCRIAVRNTSTNTHADGIEVALVACTDQNGSRRTFALALREKSNSTNVSVKAGATKYFDAVLARPHKKDAKLAPYDVQMGERVGPGKYILEFEAAGGSGLPSCARFEFKLREGGQFSFSKIS